MSECESCAYYMYDEEYDEYLCTADLDEDDIYRLSIGQKGCPFYRGGDEYSIVRKQN